MNNKLVEEYYLNETNANHLTPNEYNQYLKGISWEDILNSRSNYCYIDNDIDIDNDYEEIQDNYQLDDECDEITIPIIYIDTYTRTYNSWDAY